MRLAADDDIGRIGRLIHGVEVIHLKTTCQRLKTYGTLLRMAMSASK
jgi:hypothetical protein